MDWDVEYPPVASLCAEELSILKSQLKLKINTPLTSSMGRFFDAVAALCSVRQQVNYEAQAAIEFEALADRQEHGEYDFIVEPDGMSKGLSSQINTSPIIENVLNDLHDQVPVSSVSARFHNTVARMVIKVCDQARHDHGVNQVVLSGGVWQNLTLLNRTCDLLSSVGFTVYIHHQVPTNDGGLALGQALVAIHRMNA